jgi:hypothetical protein
MALYEMLKEDGSPFLDGACGLYNSRSDFHDFGEIITDEEARSRGLIDPDGFPVKGWIWSPGSRDVKS